MIPYWLIFFFPATASLSPFKLNNQMSRIAFIAFGLFATLLIGLRYKVGADWDTYLRYFNAALELGLIKAMALKDPGYMALNWFAGRLGFSIVGVNLSCGALFIVGLLKFCKEQPLPWLGLTVATPCLLMIVAMGYTRQAAALGFVFWALSEWKNKQFIRYCTLILIAALFHKTAIVMLVFAFTMDQKQLWVKILLGLPLVGMIALLLIANSYQGMWVYYVKNQMQSNGGSTRVLMNFIPSVLFVIFHKRFQHAIMASKHF